jgi:hypothetical protein
MGGNIAFRYTGPHFAIDSINPNYMVAIVGTLGMFVSSNEGTTWARITSSVSGVSMVPTGANLNHTQIGGMVCFDPSSHTGGSTPGIYAFIEGVGVFHSTDHGATWNQSNGENGSGMPTHAWATTCAPGSTPRVYLTNEVPRGGNGSPNGFVNVFTPGSPGMWTTTSDTTAAARSVQAGWVAFDPNDTSGPGGTSGRLIAIGYNAGQVSISTNPYAAVPTWTGYPLPISNPSCPATVGNTSIIYAGNINWTSSAPPSCFAYTGNGVFDPSVTTVNQHIMYVGFGVGVFSIVVPKNIRHRSPNWRRCCRGAHSAEGRHRDRCQPAIRHPQPNSPNV